MSGIDILDVRPIPAGERWTPQQWQAVVHRGAATLVSAAAGSGKTSVLVRRIQDRLTDANDPVDVDRLLVVTFTKAAASEMRQRLADRLAQESERAERDSALRARLDRQIALLGKAQISTLHSFCLALLRQNFHRLDLDPGFSELGEHEARLLGREVLEGLFERRYAEPPTPSDRVERFLDLVDRCGGQRGDQGLADRVLDLYETTRSLPDPDAWLEQAAARFDLPQGAVLSDLPLLEPLLVFARYRLQGARRSLALAEQLAMDAGGPSAYVPLLAAEKQALAVVCEASTLEEMRRALQAVDFQRLPTVKEGEADPEVQRRVRRLRDAAKTLVSGYRDPRSLDAWLGNADREHAAMAELRDAYAPMRTLVELVREFDRAYQDAKQERAVVDFSDQERLALALLGERDPDGTWRPSELARTVRSRIREVLVDEYQDINEVQDAIIGLACETGPQGQPPNLFMVGDPKQSIYRFRHADPSLFRDRYRTYASEGPGPRRIDLSANFRSRAEVVDAANHLFGQILTEEICQMPYDRAAELVCGAQYPDLDAPAPVEVHVISGDDPGPEPGPADDPAPEESDPDSDPAIASAREREARLAARRIRQLMGLDGGAPAQVRDPHDGRLRDMRFSDVVILLRAANSDGQTFVDELAAAGVPAHVQGKSGYFGALEIRTMLALLEVLDNPRQDIPLAAVLRSPLFDGTGLSAGDLARIRLAAQGDFVDAVRAAAGPAPAPDWPVADDLRARLAHFLDRLERWRTQARQGSLARLVWSIYQDKGFLAHASALPGGDQRRANLLALHDRAREFDRFDRQGLSRFLRFIERLKAAGEDLAMAPALSENSDVVRVMSIHASKGLEFPVVFVCGLGKAFNLQDLRGDLLIDKTLGLGPRVVDVGRRLKYPSLAFLAIGDRLRLDNLAEEIRLLYVAMTRAKERLVMVGTVRKADAALEHWAHAASCGDWPLAPDLVASARSYLDLIGLAMARPSRAPLVRFMVPAADLDRPSDPVSPVARVLEPGAPPADILARLTWRYLHREAAALPAKISVTQAAERIREQADSGGVPLDQWLDLQPPPDLRRQPRFLQRTSSALTAAERGTAAHLFMQHLDFAGPCEVSALEAQLAWMVDSEVVTPEMAGAVPLDRILDFLSDPLALRLRAASPGDLRRELPFSMAVLAREVGATDARRSDSADETVLLQGVIDAVLREADGLVVIDWKTDAARGRSAAQMAEPHLEQVALYRRAAEAMFGLPVKEAYLVFLQTGQVARV